MYFRPQQFSVRTLRDDMDVGWLVVDMASIMYSFAWDNQVFEFVYSGEYGIFTVGRITKNCGCSDVQCQLIKERRQAGCFNERQCWQSIWIMESVEQQIYTSYVTTRKVYLAVHVCRAEYLAE